MSVFDLRNHLTPHRVTNAMWDSSWLFNGHPGGAFADLDRVTDELVERGFNTIRIDAFPLLVARLAEPDGEVLFPAQPLGTWGHSTVEQRHRPLPELIRLLRLCQNKGVHVILSTWNGSVDSLPATGEDGVAELTRGWEIVLDRLAAEDLFDQILYVDFDQEYPYFSPTKARLDALGAAPSASIGNAAEAMEAAGRRERQRGLWWNEAQLDFVGSYVRTLVGHFQERHPGLRYTISLTGFWKEFRLLGLDQLEVLELHFWLHGSRFDNRSGFYRDLTKDRSAGDRSFYQRRIDQSFRIMRGHFLAEMHNRLDYARAWGREAAAPVITTEAWGPWWHMDHQGLDWGWLREWCCECNLLAADYGLWGSTPWNYSHPYFANWSDVAWYRAVNGAFLAR